MDFHKESVRPYVGHWVQCHSIYGMHEGVLHRALHDGIILIHHTVLASAQGREGNYETGDYHPSQDTDDMTHVQFLLPAPGLFVPYGGMFGLWPRPGFII